MIQPTPTLDVVSEDTWMATNDCKQNSYEDTVFANLGEKQQATEKQADLIKSDLTKSDSEPELAEPELTDEQMKELESELGWTLWACRILVVVGWGLLAGLAGLLCESVAAEIGIIGDLALPITIGMLAVVFILSWVKAFRETIYTIGFLSVVLVPILARFVLILLEFLN